MDILANRPVTTVCEGVQLRTSDVGKDTLWLSSGGPRRKVVFSALSRRPPDHRRGIQAVTSCCGIVKQGLWGEQDARPERQPTSDWGSGFGWRRGTGSREERSDRSVPN